MELLAREVITRSTGSPSARIATGRDSHRGAKARTISKKARWLGVMFSSALIVERFNDAATDEPLGFVTQRDDKETAQHSHRFTR